MNNNFVNILFFFIICSLVGCNGCKSETEVDTSYLNTTNEELQLDENQNNLDDECVDVPYTEQFGNTITIPVNINGMSLEMIYDTGASVTLITLAEARYLFSKGLLNEEDIIDYQQYQVANGQILTGLRINLKSVSLHKNLNLSDVEAVVVENLQAPLLLGQSVLKEFKKISIDRENGVVKFYKY